MAVMRKTQKDIGNYEAKLIGPFTARNCAFLGIGSVPVVFVGYILFSMKTVDAVTIFFVCALILLPFWFLGFRHPYGMKPEIFLRDYYRYHIAAPKVRKYATKTQIDLMKDKPDPNAESNNKKKVTHKKDPDFPDFL